jgi:hypothetical protein
MLWSRTRKEPKILAGAGILKFRLRAWLRDWALALGQTKVIFKNNNSYIIDLSK